MFKVLFRDMDLYKGIILASLVLLPAAGWWAWSLQTSIEKGELARVEAEKPGGLLQSIGSLQRDIEEVKVNLQRGVGGDHRTFFQTRIIKSSPTPLSDDDYVIGVEVDRSLRSLNAIDSEVSIEFKRRGREAFALPRDYINALLYNFENPPSIWKLRYLKLTNDDTKRSGGRRGLAPPPELADSWLLDRLVYARRRPDR